MPPDPNKVIEKILEHKTECAVHSDKVDVCSPPEIINKMKQFVRKAKKQTIRSGDNTTSSSTTPLDIIEAAKEATGCDSESCVLQSQEFKQFANLHNIEEIISTYFKPEGPKSSTGLLSNFDIDDFLRQLELKYTDRKFFHIPFQMIDFQEQNTSLAKIDFVEKIKQGYRTFGVVINTDVSTGNGIHWFCLFIEVNDNFKSIDLEYFNSSGKPPVAAIDIFLNRVMHTIKAHLPSYKVSKKHVATTQLQDDNHSCGVYCLAYIWARLNHIPTQWFVKDNFNDQVMNAMRKVLFRGNNG
jgi:disulfide oxidoreductase YuzD